MTSLTAGTGLPLICALKCEVAKMYNPQLRLAVENCMPRCVLNIVKKNVCVCTYVHMNAHLHVNYFVFHATLGPSRFLGAKQCEDH